MPHGNDRVWEQFRTTLLAIVTRILDFSTEKRTSAPSLQKKLMRHSATTEEYLHCCELLEAYMESTTIARENKDQRSSQEMSEGLPKMLVVFDYEAAQPTDLTIREGEIVTIIAKYDDGWWLGASASTNKIGLIPSNHLEVLPRSLFIAKAIADFTPYEKGDLSFEHGDVLVVSEANRLEGAWWYAKKLVDGEWQEGYVPSNHVEALDEETKRMYARWTKQIFMEDLMRPIEKMSR
ncbi:hypothetical protein PROFUN_01538 [Planoprotostelium fungivorum]|uniref:SH3 domain-containing protein n=1 Tax=Planoprotostelium fungivorum TaxID=1890364 RepID=A0A2P6NTL4_9EUKA|nr:hypothetical protein PROFUN_01538 [Planoprotostelium fungivorum]